MSTQKPNFTQIPNFILDNLDQYSSSEVVILNVLCRQIYGWHKDKDKISLSQFEKKTNLTKKTIIKSIKNLESKKIIRKIIDNITGISEYEILEPIEKSGFDSIEIIPPIQQGECNNYTGGSVEITPVGSVKSTHTKETINKEKQNKGSKYHCSEKSKQTVDAKLIIHGSIEPRPEDITNALKKYITDGRKKLYGIDGQLNWHDGKSCAMYNRQIKQIKSLSKSTTTIEQLELIHKKCKNLFILCNNNKFYKSLGYSFKTLADRWDEILDQTKPQTRDESNQEALKELGII